MLVKIGTDSGKSTSKFAVQNGLQVDFFKFPTNVVKGTEDGVLDGNGYLVKFGDQEYLVGALDNGTSENKTSLSKKTDEHKVSIYTGIALALKKTGNNTHGVLVDFTVNMPILLYKDKNERKAVVDFYMSNPNVNITVDGVDYSFVINSVTPYYEGIGAKVNNKSDRLDIIDTIYLDCGSLNTNYLYFKNGKIVGSKCDSLQYGGTKLEKDLESIMYKNGVKGFTETNLYSFVKNIDLCYTDKQKEVLSATIQNHVKKIIGDLESRSMNVDNINIVFSGGAVDVYKQYINKALPNNRNVIISQTNLYDNASGSLKLIVKSA